GHGVYSLDYSPDSRLLVSTAEDGFRLWEASTAREVAFVRPQSSGGEMALFPPDGTNLVRLRGTVGDSGPSITKAIRAKILLNSDRRTFSSRRIWRWTCWVSPWHPASGVMLRDSLGTARDGCLLWSTIGNEECSCCRSNAFGKKRCRSRRVCPTRRSSPRS